jgi:predicted nucleic acid-binding protein
VSVLVDTTIWSLALRRRSGDLNATEARLVAEWSALVCDGRPILIGPIRQELLSGIRDHRMFERLRRSLGAFFHASIRSMDYDQAAALFNQCRSRGVAATSVDMLICAVSRRLKVSLFTIDSDFGRYAACFQLQLYQPAGE